MLVVATVLIWRVSLPIFLLLWVVGSGIDLLMKQIVSSDDDETVVV